MNESRRALRFVLLLGVVSLFGDVTYEGARSITGPFLASLGASGAVVGIVSGLGELTGYGLRLVSGVISDRLRRYWAITITGYVINLLAVPLLALAGRWEIAAALMITERIGKAVRTPARDAMLSYASSRMGAGWAFGIHEAMDQTGAVLGPLIVAAVLHARHSFQNSFATLLVPALLALLVLASARILYPDPRDLETATATPLAASAWSHSFWMYLIAIGLVAAGFVDFPLIAYHFEKGPVPQDWIPVFYAVAMAVDAVAALAFGKWFDRAGMSVLAPVALVSSMFAPLAFFGGFGLALAGMCVWGIGMGAQESVMRAAVARMAPRERRGSAYGFFNAWYGVAWFLGSTAMGFLYDFSVAGLVAFSVVAQLLAVPIFWRLRTP